MAPAMTLNATVHEQSSAIKKNPTQLRTLLLAPSSLSSHEEKLTSIVEAHDRAATDIQMLDRLALGLVSLPSATYDVILLLSDADGSRSESQRLMNREMLTLLVSALKESGKLRSQDGQFGSNAGQERTEAILAGLQYETGVGFIKPDPKAQTSMPLTIGGKKRAAGDLNGEQRQSNSMPLNGKRKSQDISGHESAGARVVGSSGALEALEMGDSDDEIIDEDTLLTEEDLQRPVKIPIECQPKAGKRRRACKDCSCGLAKQLEAEDSTKRANADSTLNTLKLGTDDLAEVDFTVKGKVGSCGNCSLGDAFRCDGCPYVGLPPFKPGEEVRLLNDEIQL